MTDDLTMRVDRDCEMPVINVPMQCVSPLTRNKYIFTPKKIKSIRWHPDGAVIIELAGNKQPWKETEK